MRRKISLLVSIILIMSLLIGIMVACSDDTNNDNTDIGNNNTDTGNNNTDTGNNNVKKYNVTVQSANTDEGTVNNISGEYDYNSSVTLIATPKAGYYFEGWYLNSIYGTCVSTNSTYTINVPAYNVTYVAKFTYYCVTTNANLSNAGTYTSYSNKKISVGERVTLTATINDGYTWLGWYDGDTKVSEGTSQTYTFTMGEESKTYTAKWTYYTITTSTNLPEGGSYTQYSDYKVTAGEEVTLTATTNTGYTFAGWYDGDTKVSEGTSLSYTFIMGEESKTYTAKWEKCTSHTPNENCECTVCEKNAHAVNGICRHGDYVYFGSYPQTIKANDVTITTTTNDKGYYLGSDNEWYAKVTASPYISGYTFSTGTKVTDGTVYYFKVEPIKWRILSEDNGKAFILCDSIIANHRYDDSSNNYADSEIRTWLNETFYDTAFSTLQQELILTTTVDNSAASAGYSSNQYACEDTNDKVFLLSYAEVTNSSYGFETSSDRQMTTSDYSRATGACVYKNSSYYGNGWWWLRSPDYYYSYGVRYVGYGGNVDRYNYSVHYTYYGVVPALYIQLE